MKDRNTNFARYIQSFLQESKLSVRQLALLSGLEHASIGQYARGERLPRISSFIYLVLAISKFKQVSFKDELFDVIMSIYKDI